MYEKIENLPPQFKQNQVLKQIPKSPKYPNKNLNPEEKITKKCYGFNHEIKKWYPLNCQL